MATSQNVLDQTSAYSRGMSCKRQGPLFRRFTFTQNIENVSRKDFVSSRNSVHHNNPHWDVMVGYLF